MPRALSTALLPALAAAVLAGCGSGGSSSTATSAPGTTVTPAARAAIKRSAAAAKAAEAKAPQGASSVLRQIYRQFQAPKPDPALKGSAAAIRAGERACAGKTPTEVKEEFFAAAQASLEPKQAKMIAGVGSYEATAAKDPSFVAGQLAADAYPECRERR